MSTPAARRGEVAFIDRRRRGGVISLLRQVLAPRGMGGWQTPFGTAGAVQNKAMDTQMAANMEFTAAAGHACGMDFLAAKHLRQHPEQLWEKPELRDMKAYPWTTIAAQK